MNRNELMEKIHLDFQGSEFLKHNRVIEDLICHSLDISWSELNLSCTLDISTQKMAKIWARLHRLKDGEPLAYILGTQFFFEDNFCVDSRALIPRTETEILVEKALEIKPVPKRVLDLGTGTGCIGLSLAKKWPQAQILLVDSSQQALELCEQNRKVLGLSNVTLVECQVGIQTHVTLDSLSELDLVVANPPYIDKGDCRVEFSVRKFEPKEALFAPEQGRYWIELWLDWVYPRLKKGGVYIFEFGRGQQEDLFRKVESSPFSAVEIINDHTGHPRFFSLKK